MTAFDALDLEELEGGADMDLEQIRRNTVSANSRDVYLRSNVKFIAYLNLNHAEVIVDGFALNDQGEFDIAIVRTKLSDPRQDDPPLLFHLLTVQICFEW
jgi:hypothetical protein